MAWVKSASPMPVNSRDVGSIPQIRRHPTGEEMATLYSILVRKIPQTEETGGLQSMGSQKNQTWISDQTIMYINSLWRIANIESTE